MTQQSLNLNHCMVLHIHQDRTNALDLNSIAKEFAQVNERWIAFFGYLKKNCLDHIKICLHAYNEFYKIKLFFP